LLPNGSTYVRYVAVPTKDQVVTDDLDEVVAAYSGNMDTAHAYVEENKQSMMSALDQNIIDTNDSLLAILGNLHSGVVGLGHFARYFLCQNTR
jgi:hypothetical protein